MQNVTEECALYVEALVILAQVKKELEEHNKLLNRLFDNLDKKRLAEKRRWGGWCP